jgi:hypothetical protein
MIDGTGRYRRCHGSVDDAVCLEQLVEELT